MRNLTFKFYSVLKNEDAVPYVGGNLLVAADGLGGSGSAVHQIDRTQHADMLNEILSGAFGDIPQYSYRLSQYIGELIAPMADAEDDTSALWASRIVIARCVYALTEGEFKDAALNDEQVRVNLAEFIAKGLQGTVEKFALEKGKYDNQLLLPTTLAFIRYTQGEDSVIAEAVWAGDSRLYALTPLGLKLLSADDEDDSGSITNLFYAGNKRIYLNYLRYEIKGPCILMAVSDGVFDPFAPHDHLGVEHTLLTAIAESDSEQELADKLKGFFDGVRGDDATMAFAAFGFADFADMKQALKWRTEKILSIMQRQEEMCFGLEVMNLSEEEAAHYVASRTADRYDYIIQALLDAMERGISDVAITEEILSVAETARENYRTVLEAAKKERRESALAELNKYVLLHPELVASEILTANQIRFDEQKLGDLYFEFKKTAVDLALQSVRYEEEVRRVEEFAAEKQRLHERIMERIAYYSGLFEDMWDNAGSKASGERVKVSDILCVWRRMDNALKFCWGRQDTGKLPSGDKELSDAVLNFNSRCREWDINKKSLRDKTEKIRSAYVRLWERLFDYFKRCGYLTNQLLNPDAVQKFGLNESDDRVIAFAGKTKQDVLLQEFKAEKETVVPRIVHALALGYDKTSVIDEQYNATKLNLFRTYYRLLNNPDNGIKEFDKELLALESEYTSLVEHAKL